MERREFLTVAGTVALSSGMRNAEFGMRNDREQSIPHSALRIPHSQNPTLAPQVFAQRIQRAQDELKSRKLDLLVVEPSTNFQYFTSYNPGRSERLILLMIPANAAPVIVCPSFEVERIKRNTTISDARGWEEQDDPWALVTKAAQQMKPAGRDGLVAIEPTTSYQSYLRLTTRVSGWKAVDGSPVTEHLRIIKSPEEITLIRAAIAATEASIAATFTQLVVDMTERDVAALLSREMASRGSPGGGLVQFGPSSALPHGGPSAGKLTRETVVLIDAGSRVEGYTSDITRTIWFGDAPSDEFKKVYNIVHDAQTAAVENARPGVTQCQQVDRAARKVITDAGYGQYFTHRLGHGMGMDGHEPPYMVEGNTTIMEPGIVFSDEPGIYQLGKFGVRIEDDCTMTASGVEFLSQRPAKL
ncbi:MAG TPA: Xaa-Pro peptidase family protein [Gemmatimonadales bacterium]|nr:Xaa-Pro peptidase family protein [Gemmatimonadales bacterium]